MEFTEDNEDLGIYWLKNLDNILNIIFKLRQERTYTADFLPFDTVLAVLILDHKTRFKLHDKIYKVKSHKEFAHTW